MSDRDNIIVLTDEDGNDMELELLDVVCYRGEDYVVLIGTDDDDDEVIILKVDETDEDDESYVGVEDEETLEAVFAIFKERFEDDFNFAD